MKGREKKVFDRINRIYRIGKGRELKPADPGNSAKINKMDLKVKWPLRFFGWEGGNNEWI